MTSNHHDHDHDGIDEGEFDADDPDDYGHVPFPARRVRRGTAGGQVTARFADGSRWLAYTGSGVGEGHPWSAVDRTGVFDPQAAEDYRPPTEHD